MSLLDRLCKASGLCGKIAIVLNPGRACKAREGSLTAIFGRLSLALSKGDASIH